MRVLLFIVAGALLAIFVILRLATDPTGTPTGKPDLVLERVESSGTEDAVGSVFRLVGTLGSLADRDVRIVAGFRSASVLSDDLRARMLERGEQQEVRARNFLQDGLEARVRIRDATHEGTTGRELEVSLAGRVEVASSVLLRDDPADAITEEWTSVERVELIAGTPAEIGRFRGMPVLVEVIVPTETGETER